MDRWQLPSLDAQGKDTAAWLAQHGITITGRNASSYLVTLPDGWNRSAIVMGKQGASYVLYNPSGTQMCEIAGTVLYTRETGFKPYKLDEYSPKRLAAIKKSFSPKKKKK